LEEAAKKGDSKGFADAAKKAVGAQKELLPKVREHAEHEDDPLKKRLVDFLPQQKNISYTCPLLVVGRFG